MSARPVQLDDTQMTELTAHSETEHVGNSGALSTTNTETESQALGTTTTSPKDLMETSSSQTISQENVNQGERTAGAEYATHLLENLLNTEIS